MLILYILIVTVLPFIPFISKSININRELSKKLLYNGFAIRM